MVNKGAERSFRGDNAESGEKVGFLLGLSFLLGEVEMTQSEKIMYRNRVCPVISYDQWGGGSFRLKRDGSVYGRIPV